MSAHQSIGTPQDLSIVTSTYNSESTIGEFLNRARAAVAALEVSLMRPIRYEIVIVDDGSTDNCVEVLKEEVEHSKDLKFLVLAQNYGQHLAMLQGMQDSTGDFVFVLDSDLEEDPDWLLHFWKKLITSGGRSVHGEYLRTDGPYLRRKGGELFWRLFNSIGRFDLPINQTMARLMTRDFLNSALANRRISGLLAPILAAAGPSESVLVKKSFKGSSAYSIRRKFSLAVRQMLVSSSEVWWRITISSFSFGVLGIFIALGALAIGANVRTYISILLLSGFSICTAAMAAVGYMLRGVVENASDIRPVIVGQRYLPRD